MPVVVDNCHFSVASAPPVRHGVQRPAWVGQGFRSVSAPQRGAGPGGELATAGKPTMRLAGARVRAWPPGPRRLASTVTANMGRLSAWVRGGCRVSLHSGAGDRAADGGVQPATDPPRSAHCARLAGVVLRRACAAVAGPPSAFVNVGRIKSNRAIGSVASRLHALDLPPRNYPCTARISTARNSSYYPLAPFCSRACTGRPHRRRLEYSRSDQ